MRRFKPEEIQEIIEILKKDGVISVPTDTVYGVCSQVSSHQAEENLRNVKHRPLTKAFPVMCADLEQILEIAEDFLGMIEPRRSLKALCQVHSPLY